MFDLPRPPRTIETERLRLCFESVRPGDKDRGFVPFYHFHIQNLVGEKVGHINFRVGDTEHVRNCAGHIGYVILEQFRGGEVCLSCLLCTFGIHFLYLPFGPNYHRSQQPCIDKDH